MQSASVASVSLQGARGAPVHVTPRWYGFSAMVAVAWTAIGLLAATLLGSLYWLGSRIDGQSARIDALSARIDALVQEVARQGARLEGHLQSHTR